MEAVQRQAVPVRDHLARRHGYHFTISLSTNTQAANSSIIATEDHYLATISSCTTMYMAVQQIVTMLAWSYTKPQQLCPMSI